MEKLNVYSFYSFGSITKEHILRLTEIDLPFSEQMFSVYILKTWFKVFLERSSDTTWRATRDSARQMIDLLKASDHVETAGDLQMFELDYTRQIHKLLRIFEGTFASENEGSNVFSVSRKGTHDHIALMEAADDNLPPDTKARLSPETIRDIRDAGKCLALDCHTASGYHILRAVERVVIKYVEKVTGKAYGVKNRNWGAYIRVLTANKADASVIGYLDHMRQFYRNPIIHPEDTLSGTEAFSLFNASLSALVQLDAAIEAWP